MPLLFATGANGITASFSDVRSSDHLSSTLRALDLLDATRHPRYRSASTGDNAREDGKMLIEPPVIVVDVSSRSPTSDGGNSTTRSDEWL
jgi:hypothetical protein